MEVEKELTELIHINNELQDIVSKSQESIRVLKLLQEYFNKHTNLDYIEKKWATREVISTFDIKVCSVETQNKLIKKGDDLIYNKLEHYQVKECKNFYFLKTQIININKELSVLLNNIS